jgi:hypothetical protein
VNITELEALARAAALVSSDWKTDHDDTYVAAQKIPNDHDWYWVVGSMAKHETNYDPETTDNEMRGPKEVVQAHCRFVAAANPAIVLELISKTKTLTEALEKIYEKSTDNLIAGIALDALSTERQWTPTEAPLGKGSS